MQLRDTGTQRGLREGSGRGHGDPAHATQAAHRTAGGQKGLLLVFPQQSRNKQTMAPSSLCSLLRTAGAEWDRWAGVLEPGSGTAQLGQWHGLLSGSVAGRLGPTYSLWRTAASGAPPSWPGLVSSSVVFMLPVFGGGSYDLPACLGDGSQAVQFLVKEDKTKQTEERATCHRELRQCLVTVWVSPAERHTHGFLPRVPALEIFTDAQELNVLSLCSVRAGLRQRWEGKRSVPPGSPHGFSRMPSHPPDFFSSCSRNR